MLLGHFDTVWPVGQLAANAAGTGRRPPSRARDVFDMKAGIALGMLAARAARLKTRSPSDARVW